MLVSDLVGQPYQEQDWGKDQRRTGFVFVHVWNKWPKTLFNVVSFFSFEDVNDLAEAICSY